MSWADGSCLALKFDIRASHFALNAFCCKAGSVDDRAIEIDTDSKD